MIVCILYSDQSRILTRQHPCPGVLLHETGEQVSIRYNDLVTFSRTKENPFEENKDWKTFTKVLEEYKVFHRMKLQQLKSSPNDKTVKTLTWACSHELCSGIGDQLMRTQYFLLLAMMSDRLFTIYWDKHLQQMTKYIIPNEIDWTYFNKSKGMCDDKRHCLHEVLGVTSLWGFGWNTQEFSDIGQVLFSNEQHITVSGNVLINVMMVGNSSVDQGEQIVNGFKKLGVRQILLEKPNDTVYIDHRPLLYNMLHKLGVHHLLEIPETGNGRMQPTNAWLYVSHVIFTYLFGFSQTLLSKVEEYQKSLGLYHVDYLVVHLRTGFLGDKDQESISARYIFNGWKLFTDPKHWRCIIQHGIDLRDKTMGSNASIYLSTDSYLVKDMVLREFGDKHITFGDNTLVHSKNRHKECETGGILATWLDFLMLAEAKAIVHAESSFSINAAFLKPIPHSSHSWIMNNNDRGCLAAHNAGNTNCIC